MTAPLLKNRVGVSTTTTGTGTVTLGAALTAAANILPGKWLAFGSGGAGLADGSVVRYLIIAANGDVEWGKGTLGGSGTTLTRTLTGSTTGSLLSLSGTSQVFIGAIGEDIVPYDAGVGVAIAETTASSSTTTGALTVAGGVGVTGNVFIGGFIQATTLAANTSFILSGNSVLNLDGSSQINLFDVTATPRITFGNPATDKTNYYGADTHDFRTYGYAAIIAQLNATGLDLKQTTASTSTTSGALTVAGGVGIGGALNVGGSTLTGGSVPVINWSQTWNNAGSRFTGNQFTITPTAFVAASSVLDVAGTTNSNVWGFTVNGGTLGGGSTGGGIRMDGAVYGTSVATSDDATVAIDSYASRNTDGGVGLRMKNTAAVMWASSGNWWGVGDTFLTRAGAATLQYGQADAAAPVAQTIQAQSVVAGTSNTASPDFTIAGSKGTGTGAGGDIVFKAAPPGTSGTAQNATVERLRIDSANVIDARQVVGTASQEAFGLSFLFKSLTANVAYTNTTPAQNWFATAGAIAVEAATTYEFEGQLLQTNGTTSHTVALLFAGTATLTSIAYSAWFAAGVLNGAGVATFATQVNTAASTVVTPAITTAGTVIWVRGLVRINAAGTFIPQFAFSAAPGAGNNLANTFFKLRKVGSNTNVNQGNWA